MFHRRGLAIIGLYTAYILPACWLLSNLYGPYRHISEVEPASSIGGAVDVSRAMHIPSPLFDHNWDRRSRSREIENAERQLGISARRVVWEIGVVLLVPLAGAVFVEMLLRVFHVT